MSAPVLSVRNLCVSVRSGGVPRRVVQHIDFDVQAGEVLALLGEHYPTVGARDDDEIEGHAIVYARR